MKLLRGIKELEDLLSRRLVSCEFEILLAIHAHPHISAKELFEISRYSGTAFYAALKQLGESGFIVGRPASHDRRLMLYNLSDQVREEMDQHLFAAITH